MNDFKRNDRFGTKRPGAGFGKKQFDRPAFGGKPAYNRPGAGFARPQVQMYPATCAQCNQATEVPFRPDGQRPLYCRDCLGGNKSSASTFSAPSSAPVREVQRPVFRAPVPMPQASALVKPQAPDPRIDELQRNLAKIEMKLDQVLIALAVSKALATVEPTPAPKKKPAKKK